jgi:hypothetical protein
MGRRATKASIFACGTPRREGKKEISVIEIYSSENWEKISSKPLKIIKKNDIIV